MMRQRYTCAHCLSCICNYCIIIINVSRTYLSCARLPSSCLVSVPYRCADLLHLLKTDNRKSVRDSRPFRRRRRRQLLFAVYAAHTYVPRYILISSEYTVSRKRVLRARALAQLKDASFNCIL